ncbi:MAG: metallophosphoesterase, partial [Clostridia bacterium]|nr:metallophosphoesterase [Clostridia bacterium]
TQPSAELMAALRAQVALERPGALIVTGDLSFNGERASHLALAEWFRRIEADGTPVWVLPGNHDINVPAPHGFTKEGWYPTEAVTPETFSAIYADFMGPAAGEANLSYAVEVDERLWIAMTDVAYYLGAAQTFGLFTAGHAAWLEEMLAAAGKAEVITATHHNLLPHTRFSQESFVMFGWESMAALNRRYGVRLNLSGHIHAQNIAAQEGLTDVSTGAFCSWPHRYALVELEDGGALVYQAKALDGALLPEGFERDSRTWFSQIAGEKTLSSLPEGEPARREAMAAYAARLNLAWFSGTYRADDPSWRADPAYALWEDSGTEAPGWTFMRALMDETRGDQLSLRLE